MIDICMLWIFVSMRYFLFSILAFFFLAGCETKRIVHGNVDLSPDVISALKAKKGRAEKQDVIKAIGEPSYILSFDKNTWYYVMQNSESQLWFYPEVKNSIGYEILFSDDGKLISIASAQSPIGISPCTEKTDFSIDHRSSLLQRIFRNAGKVQALAK